MWFTVLSRKRNNLFCSERCETMAEREDNGETKDSGNDKYALLGNDLMSLPYKLLSVWMAKKKPKELSYR